MSIHAKPAAGPDNEQIASNLRAEMARQSMTLRTLSGKTAELGHPISAPQLSRYIRGEKAMDVDEIRVITTAMGLKFGGLFAGIEL